MGKIDDKIFYDFKNGSKMAKSAVTSYTIDLDNILKSPNFAQIKDVKNLHELYCLVRTMLGKQYNYSGNQFIDFSENLKLGEGDCMEKSLLFQISMDFFRKIGNHPLAGKRSFYINAGVKQKGDQYFSPHAFNIVEAGGYGLLIDLENPSFEEDREIPYIVPIKRLDSDTGEILLQKRFAMNRIYAL